MDSASAPKGLAITSVNTNGTLYYSTNGGSSWTVVSGASNTNALPTLATAGLLRQLPTANLSISHLRLTARGGQTATRCSW